MMKLKNKKKKKITRIVLNDYGASLEANDAD